MKGEEDDKMIPLEPIVMDLLTGTARPANQPAPQERRFGDRLLIILEDMGRVSARQIGEIAVAINRDAEEQHAADCAGIAGLMRGQRLSLRQQVDEAVDGLEQLVTFDGVQEGDEELVPMVRKEDLLEALDRIFGERTKRQPVVTADLLGRCDAILRICLVHSSRMNELSAVRADLRAVLDGAGKS